MSTEAMVFPSSGVIEKLHPKQSTPAESDRKAEDNFEMIEPMNDTPSPNDAPLEQDDLQQIKGIGPSIAQTLFDLGIRTFDQLAEYNAERLADLLRDRIPAISAQRIESNNWIDQARTLALAKQGADRAAFEPTQRTDIHPEGKAGDVEKPRRKNWRELADFFVSFGFAIDPDGQERLQTKVHHSQGDSNEKWEGVSTQHLIRWMISQADLPMPSDLEAPLKTEDMVDEPSEVMDTAQEAQLEIVDLWVSEKQTPVEARDTESLALLQTEARLVLSGPDAIDLTSNENPYTIDIYLVNTEDKHTELVATISDYLIPGEMVYDIQEVFLVPPVGRYQLTVVARLLPPAALVTHLQGPIIRVESKSKKTPQR